MCFTGFSTHIFINLVVAFMTMYTYTKLVLAYYFVSVLSQCTQKIYATRDSPSDSLPQTFQNVLCVENRRLGFR